MNDVYKEYPFIKQLMPLPDNVEVMMKDTDTGEEWYCGDADNVYTMALIALVEEVDERGKVFTETHPYIIDSDGLGELMCGESSNIEVHIVPKRR